jgi:hypothetical protein
MAARNTSRRRVSFSILFFFISPKEVTLRYSYSSKEQKQQSLTSTPPSSLSIPLRSRPRLRRNKRLPPPTRRPPQNPRAAIIHRLPLPSPAIHPRRPCPNKAIMAGHHSVRHSHRRRLSPLLWHAESIATSDFDHDIRSRWEIKNKTQ